MSQSYMPQLVEALQHGNLTIFLGGDLAQEATGLPGRAELAVRLARRLGLSGTPPPWPDVAAQYEMAAGLAALIGWLRDQIEPAEHRPGPIYRLLAQLPVATYLTTIYDAWLHDALRAAGRRPNLAVVDASSLSLLDARRPTVVHLLGVCDRLDSLVLTATQMQQLPQSKAQILAGLVHPTLAHKSVLIVGQDLRDPYFQTLYQTALFQAGAIRPMAFAACPGLADWEKQSWLQKQVRVLDVAAMDLLGELVSGIPPAALAAQPTGAPHEQASWPSDGTSTSEPSPAKQPPASGRAVYAIHIQNAQGLAIGDEAQVIMQPGRDAGEPGGSTPAGRAKKRAPLTKCPAATLTWLHLSDLHFRKSHAYDENVVLKALLRDLAEQQVRPDVIAVSGDIAFSGQPAEYDLARRFFDDLLQVTGLGKDRLFLVPGNHDIDRNLISTGARAIGDSLTDRDRANSLLAAPADRKLVFARFKGYAAFVKAYLGTERRFDDSHYFYVQSLELAGQRIALLGVNSAWLCASDLDRATGLLIGERQARAALEQAEGANLKIALLHHPFDWLREFDQNDSATMLTDGCDFILHGHLHQAAATQLTSPDGAATILACGACYETRSFPNMYNWVRLDLAAGTGTVCLRRYSDSRGGFWAKDTLTYKNVPDGTYTFPLRGRFAPTGPDYVAAGLSSPVMGAAPVRLAPVAPSQPAQPADSLLVATRDLLLAAFTADDLRRLLLYTSNPALRPLLAEFSPGDGLAAMIEKTLTYCHKRDLMPALLDEARVANPKQYARFAPRLGA